MELANEIDARINMLAESAVDRQYRLQPELWEKYGKKGRELSVRDMKFHLSYLIESLRSSDPSVFVNYMLWVKELFRGLNFLDESLPVMLECIREVIRETLTDHPTDIISEYIESALQKTGHVRVEETTFIPDTAPYAELARAYLDSLLQGNRSKAAKLIADAVEKGVSIPDIYLHVFQASQYEIGRLWHLKQVTVAQEHFCSAATERIMSQLYARIFSMQRIGRSYVGACVGGELHQIGARMVADFFEMSGWDTYYMGANTPTSSILQSITDNQADILGLSLSIRFYRPTIEELIHEVRLSPNIPKNLKILVGGYAFIQQPDLWKRVGADGFARNAQDAVEVAARWFVQ